MWRNIVESDRPQMTMCSMRFTCWTPKATNTHSDYVIIIAFPLQQGLRNRASMLRYMYIACLVLVIGFIHSLVLVIGFIHCLLLVIGFIHCLVLVIGFIHCLVLVIGFIHCLVLVMGFIHCLMLVIGFIHRLVLVIGFIHCPAGECRN